MIDCTLVVMAKAPLVGKVKTRLAACLPPIAIPRLYRCFLADTLALAQSLPAVEVAVMSPASDVDELLQISGGLPVIAQSGEGLSAALTSVFAHFTASGSRRIVAFNSDSPHLPKSALLTAFELLSRYDIAIGPTQDGGYHLVGAKASHPRLFTANTMGTTNALDSLLSRARALGLSVGFADTIYDIDLPEDLCHLQEDLRLTPERAPLTAQWLADWTPPLLPQRALRGEQ